MPARKDTIVVEKSPVSERLELAKAISNVASKTDAFTAAIEHFKGFSKEVLTKLDLDIEAKRLSLEDLKKDIENNIKNGKIDIDVALKEYKREGAIAMLKEMNETVISTKELDSLKKELNELRTHFDDLVAKAKKEEAERREKAISAAVKNMDLTHKAENAQVLALSEQREREISNLKSTIVDLRTEISAQRELTRSVAEAGRQQMNYLPQAQSARS